MAGPNAGLLMQIAQGGRPQMADAFARGAQQGNALLQAQQQQQDRKSLQQIAQAYAQGGPEQAAQIAGQTGQYDAVRQLDNTQYSRGRDTSQDQFREKQFSYGQQRDQAGDAWKQNRANTQDSQWQQSFGLQKQQVANSANKAPQVKTIKLADGSESAVQWDRQAGEWVPINAPQGGGTARPKGKLTESEQKLTLFQSMQNETQPVLVQMEQSFDPANVPDAAARLLPGGNFWQSPEGQQYTVASAAWSEGALRIATGAAATEPEIKRTVATYFAQPGDDPETVQFKQQMRNMYSRSIQRGLGYNDVTGKLETPLEFANKIDGGNAGKADMSKPETSKVINGIQYEKHNGQWYTRQQ